jgi:glycosyltransferase involved in cell wall biosynthesis
MITFNQERFIGQAIESVLMQITDFDFELVVSDDGSTDRTPEIIRSLQDRFPKMVRSHLRDRNVGLVRNLTETLEACDGEYVALLEGDDYWIAAHKLQAQVDFLDRHPECVACFHNAQVVDDAGAVTEFYNRRDAKPALTLEDVLDSNYIATCSVMYRAHVLATIPPWFHTLEWGDWPLHIIAAQHGRIGYLEEPMAAYRVHPGGAWSRLSASERLEKLIGFYARIDAALAFEHHPRIGRRLLTLYEKLTAEYENTGRRGKVTSAALRALWISRTLRAPSTVWAWKALLRPWTRWIPSPARRFVRAAAGARRSLHRPRR